MYNPDPEKIAKLSTFIRNFGYTIKSKQEEIHPKELQKLLANIEDTPQEALISRLTLRSMKQAKYTIDCTGHFGLACQFYCHFTSPIRRYPDLQIHRIIKEQIRGRMNENRVAHYNEILPEVAQHSSEMERRADEAERETDKLKKVEYMEEHLGEIYEGVISSITSWGVYVELPNTIEGMIHVSMLPGDYFYYDEESYEMVGQATNLRYKLGQKLKVRVNATDKISRTIDFVIPQEWELELTNTQIRNTLAAFLFTGEDVFKKISSLSGGERGRVSLAKLMLSESNFLILDEPTNHLDITSKEILESALNAYEGTVLYVSHDRYFINKTASRILELTHREFINYIGNYDYYLEKKQTPMADESNSSVEESAPSAQKLDWKQQKEQQAAQRKKENDLKKCEDRIAQLEAKAQELDEEMSRPEIATNVARLQEIAREKNAIEEELNPLYEKWEALSE